MSRKGLSWFLTEPGRTFSYYLMGTAVSGAMIASFVPHTILLDEYKNLVRLHKKGRTVPVPEKLEKRFQKALDLVEVDKRDKHLFRPFMVYGFDIFSAGTDLSRYGVAVGLPINFTYDSVETLEKPKVSVKEESVIWETETGKELLHSLVLSENAQLYAMAREIKFRQTHKVLFDTFFATAAVSVATGFSSFINRQFDLYSKPRKIRVVVYCLVSALAAGNYFFSKDLSTVYYEEKIDKELKEKNPIFCEGGKEFYEKNIMRNIALRKLMGKEGEKMYTVLGNENYLFRTKHLPLVHRKKFFDNNEDLGSVEIQ